MDQKRGNARQGASRTSVASRHAAGMPANAGNVARKYGSEVSLTPSQAKQNVENPRKSPLDALSRMSNRQDPFQRRSGLQDVDDSFLASNAFARPARLRHSGLEGTNMPVAGTPQPAANAAVAPIRVASGQEPPQQQMQYQQQQPPQMQQPQQQLQSQAGQIPQQSVANMAPAQVQMQQQQQQPAAPVQQQQSMAPAAVVSAQQPQQSMPQQQNQHAPQYVQPPAAGQSTRHDPYTSGRAHVQHQQQQDVQQQQMGQQDAKGQGQAQAQMQQQQQQQQPMQQQQQPPAQMSPRKYQQMQQQQQQQQGYTSQAANAVPPAAEMCTTCPNCQTTIYLVRTPELGHGDAGLPMQ